MLLMKTIEILFYNEILKGYSNYKMIDFLVARGANIDIKDINERSVVDIIVEAYSCYKRFKKIEIHRLAPIFKEGGEYDILLKKVLTCKPNINIYKTQMEQMFCLIMMLYNDFETLRLIINYGINLNSKDKSGRSSFSFYG